MSESTESVVLMSSVGTLATASASQYPTGATPLAVASRSLANGVATATLASAIGRTVYITGFEVTGSGATLGLPVTVTVANTLGGTLSYTYCAGAGVLLANTPLFVAYAPGIPASGTNVSIAVSCPALGLGNTNNTVSARGYLL